MSTNPIHVLLLHTSGSWTTLLYTKGRSAEEINFRTIYSVSSTETGKRSFACIFRAPLVTSCNILKSVYTCIIVFYFFQTVQKCLLSLQSLLLQYVYIFVLVSSLFISFHHIQFGIIRVLCNYLFCRFI
jgi:hypothetical protein